MQKVKNTRIVNLNLTHLSQFFHQFNILLIASGLLVLPNTHAALGELDPTFEKRWDSTGTIDQVLVLPNDQLLLSSSAFSLKSNKDASSRLIQQPLLRCNPDGSLDPSFVLFKNRMDRVRLSVEATPGALALDAREGILFAGSVVGSGGDGILIHHLVRFFADGSLDNSFNIGSGPNGQIRVISPLPDGRIWIAGDFTQVHGNSASHLAMLNQQGAFMESFKLGEGFNKPVESGFTDDQGRFVAIGKFDVYDGQPVNGLVRINLDGSIDTSFDVNDSYVKKAAFIIAGPDNSVFVSEPHGNFGGPDLPPIVKYNSNGSLDTQFKFGEKFDRRLVKSMVLASDDSHLFIVVSEANSIDRELRILKIDSFTGEIDGSFTDRVQPLVGDELSLHIHSDLGLLMKGDFKRVNGIESNGLARVQTETRQNSSPVIRHFTGSQVLANGDGLNLMTSVTAHPSPSYQWFFDGAPLPFENRPNLQRHFANSSHQGFYHLVISNEQGEIVTDPVEVVVHRGEPGSIDHDFVFPSVFDRIEPLWVRAFLFQDDQRILIAGHLQVQRGDNTGGPNGGALPHIVRLLPNGAFDPSFDPGAGPNKGVDCVLVLPSGNLFLGGSFSEYDGINRQGYAVTSQDGELLGMEEGTVHGNMQRTLLNQGTQQISAGSMDANDRIYLAGKFGEGDQVKDQIIRLHSDGILDSSFPPLEAIDGSFWHLYSHPDQSLWVFNDRRIWQIDVNGNILHGPDQFENLVQRSFFTKFLATSSGDTLISGVQSTKENPRFLDRWLSIGQFDSEFPVYSPTLLGGGDVTSLGVTSDDSIYVGRLVRDSIPNTLFRLTSTGALDRQFMYSKYGNSVYNFLILPNGDLIVLGDFIPQSGVQSSLAKIVGLSSTKTIHLLGKLVQGQIQIKFNSKPDLKYQLLSKSSLNNPEWLPVAETISSGFESAFIHDTDDHPSLFYRVIQIEE